ncbi:MAG: hypothetical protein GY938_00570 [Ketobacter sp.]|nr:hypothetical protein [Ketobacter sp.]
MLCVTHDPSLVQNLTLSCQELVLLGWAHVGTRILLLPLPMYVLHVVGTVDRAYSYQCP